jgi:hypothetical protein
MHGMMLAAFIVFFSLKHHAFICSNTLSTWMLAGTVVYRSDWVLAGRQQ